MNTDLTSLDHRLLSLLQAVRDTPDDSARATLNQLLRTDTAARAAMARLLVDEQALISRLRDDSIVSLLDPAPTSQVKVTKATRWISWRPLTAAAAGIVFGMFCTSMVFGYVTQRVAVKKMPLKVFDPGMENLEAVFDKSLPHQAGKWGVDSARVVTTENGVSPKEGQRMLRLEPIPREKNVKNLASRVYQVIDLRSLPFDAINGTAEVQVTASFFATKSEISSRYLIRAFALSEAPEQATKDFWSKREDDGVVSMAQRFDTLPGDRGWHSFSLKMPLPPGSQTLVLILGAVPPEDVSTDASVHYLDEVSVSLLTLENTQLIP
jgi:hypothetical protein